MEIKYTDFKQTWKRAKSLKIKSYLQIVPLCWWGIELFITIGTFRLSIFWLIAQIVIYSFLFVNTVFYPWFRIFVSECFFTRWMFPDYLDKGILFYAKMACMETIFAYQETSYDYTTYLSKGQFYTTRNNYSKRANAVDVFMMNTFIAPVFRFFFLNTIGILSFIFGWIFVPWCFKRQYSKDSQNNRKSY